MFYVQLTSTRQQYHTLLVEHVSKLAKLETLEEKLLSAGGKIESLKSRLAELETKGSQQQAKEKEDAGNVCLSSFKFFIGIFNFLDVRNK